MAKKNAPRPQRVTTAQLDAKYNRILLEFDALRTAFEDLETHTKDMPSREALERMLVTQIDGIDTMLVTRMEQHRLVLRQCMDQVATPLLGIEKMKGRLDAFRTVVERVEQKMPNMGRRRSWYSRITNPFNW